jgi:hypothetical protein
MSKPAFVKYAYKAERGYLSNFTRVPDRPLVFRGHTYPSIEHAFHAHKVACFTTGASAHDSEKYTTGGVYARLNGLSVKRTTSASAYKRHGWVLDVGGWHAAKHIVMRQLVAARAEVDPAYIKAATILVRKHGAIGHRTSRSKYSKQHDVLGKELTLLGGGIWRTGTGPVQEASDSEEDA